MGRKYKISVFDDQWAMDPQGAELAWSELKDLFSGFADFDGDKRYQTHFNGCEFAVQERRQDNVRALHILVLDFDDGMSVEDAKLHFKAYRHIGYTSFNHQYDKQGDGTTVDKFRILLPLKEPCLLKDWMEVRHNVVTFAPGVDMASVRLHQPFAVPLRRSGSPYELWSSEGEELDWTTWERSEHKGHEYSLANPSQRSEHKLDADFVLETKNGNIRFGDVDGMISGVKCPLHDDKQPSEFANKSANGNVFLYCKKCGTIYMESARAHSLDPIAQFVAKHRPEDSARDSESDDDYEQIDKELSASERAPQAELVEFDNDLAVEPYSREQRSALLRKKYKSTELRTLLYASEGFGKSYLARVLVDDGRKVLFACKSNEQVEEQAQGFLDDGMRVQIICARDYWLRTNHDVEIEYYEQAHPWDTKKINDERTKQNMRQQGFSNEEINSVWERYAPRMPDWEQCDLVVTTQARVLSWGRIQARRRAKKFQGVSATKDKTVGEILEGLRDIVPRDIVVFCDDAQSEDFCLLADFENKFANKNVDGRAIRRKEVGGRIYFLRPRSYLFGYGMDENQIIFSTTETVTRELIFNRYGGKKRQVVDDNNKKSTVGKVYEPTLMPDGKLIAGNITMIKTEVVRKKSDGLIPVILERVRKLWTNDIAYIADGQGSDFNHVNSKGQNIFRDSDLVIEISHQHEEKVTKFLHELDWTDEYRWALKIALALDTLHQAIGRNAGYRFSDKGDQQNADEKRETVVLMEPYLFDDVIGVMRYHHENVVNLDDHSVRFKRSDIGTELFRTLGWYIQNKARYIVDRNGQLFLADAKTWLSGGSIAKNQPSTRKKRLLMALRTLSERTGGRTQTSVSDMVATVEGIELPYEAARTKSP